MSENRCKWNPDDRVEYSYGEMDHQRSEAFASHLDGCPACRAEVDELEHAAGLCRQVREDPVPEPVWTRHLQLEPECDRGPWWSRPWLLWAPAAAGAVALLLWLVVGRPWVGPEPAPAPEPAPPVVPVIEPERPTPALALEIVEKTGQVQLRSANAVGTRPFEASSALHSGDVLVTAAGARVDLELQDGSRIRAGERTRLRFETIGADGDRIRLLVGALACRVAPRSPTRPFSVDASTGRVVVRGTRFAVHLALDGGLSVGVEKGAVELAPIDSRFEAIIIRAGQQASLEPTGGPIRTGKLDLSRMGGSLGELMAPLRPGKPAVRSASPKPRPKSPKREEPRPDRPGPAGDDSLEALVARIHQDTGWIFDDFRSDMAKGRFESVLRKLENYLADPDSPGRDEATFMQAVCCEKLGRRREAIRNYRKYLMTWPTGKRASDARTGMRRIRSPTPPPAP